jgi:hypothetical protein
MKATDLMKTFGLSLLILFAATALNAVKAQEYDDLYFNGSDRKTVKIDKALLKSQQNDVVSSSDYKEISGTTENFSAKNVNPEYIARYKSSDQNEANESSAYSGEDYFIEDYEANKEKVASGENYLNSRKYNREYTRQTAPSNTFDPMWQFNTFMGFGAPMGMGFGAPWGMRPGFGFGYGPYSGWNMSMSMGWGTGFYNPYSMWNSPFAMYDPWFDPWYGSGFYNGFNSPFAFGYNPYRFGGFGLHNSWYGGGWGRPIYVVNAGMHNSDMIYRTPSGSRMEYQPRTSTRSNTASYVRPQSSDRVRRAESTSNLRTVSRERASDASGRIATDYARTQNEYYNRSRSARVQSARSDLQQSSSQVNQRLMNRAGTSTRDYRSSSMINNRPVRSDSYNRSSGSSTYQRSDRSYSNFDSNRSRSSSSYSSPSRSSSYGSSYGSSSGRSSSGGSRSSSFSGGRR